MVPAPRKSKNGTDQRKSSRDFMSSKALVLLIIAVGTGELCLRSPRSGAAVVAAVTILTMLNRLIR
jgi:hypothetical protein